MRKYILRLTPVLIIIAFLSCNDKQVTNTKNEINLPISTYGNSWVVNNPDETKKIISEKGVSNWDNPHSVIRTYFSTEKTGKINIGLRVKISDGISKIKVTLNEVSREIEIASSIEFNDVFVGSFNIEKPGYVFVELQGLSKSGSEFGQIESVLVGGEVVKGDLIYVKDDFYWGRRGPSVHLTYEIPSPANEIVYYYNEMTIPKGQDVIGSYFMANGFSVGYFGIQVNSETERRILFSVWSPYKTDDPNSIPEDQKIILLSKGENVITGEFGNEGSGGQSRKVFDWQTEVTYRFLLKGEPSENNSTDFKAYFYAPEIGKWELIAAFRRPKTTTYIERPHSFLENFIPSTGNESRIVKYSNQWVFDTSGKWFEMTSAKFTADATARKYSRLDYSGGDIGNYFYLKNCGFFSENTLIDSILKRVANGTVPIIDFDQLPN